MARKKQTDNQFSFDDYKLKQVDVRLKLMDGPSYYSKTPILNASDAVDVMRDVMKELDREWVCVVNLDNHLKPVNFNVVSIGSINLSLAPVQNILKSGLLSNCNRLILLHNHPSGELTPSDEDNQLTKRVTEAAKLLEMEVLDHVIVGGQTGEIYSFRQDHPELFSMENIDLDYIHRMENAVDRGFAEESIAYGTDDKNIPKQALDQELAERKASYQAKGKYDPKQAAENRKMEMKEITEKLEQGVQDVFESNRYKEWLQISSKLHHYSVNNQLLIMIQKPDASMVAGYQAWQSKFHRQVNKGEKGIAILSPIPYQRHVTAKDPDTGEEKDKTITALSYKPAYVWDVSQTSGQDIPSLVTELKGNIDRYKDLFEAVRRISPVPISFEEMQGEAKGYYSDAEKRIVIKSGMDQIQSIKTVLHEISHARLACSDNEQKKDRATREVEAESSAFVVTSALGLDTSEYSFGYVAGWSSGKDTKELKASMETIRQNSAIMIDQIQDNLQEIQKEHEQERFEELARDVDKEMNDRIPERAERSQDENQDETRRALKENPEEIKNWLESQHDDKTDKLAERVAVICAAVIAAKAVIKPEIKQENVQALTM